MSRWQDCIFDLYGTLADIRTDENSPCFWHAIAAWYRKQGADYPPAALQKLYSQFVRQLEEEARTEQNGCPEIHLEHVFALLFQEKGISAGDRLLQSTGAFFRWCSLQKLCLYQGTLALLQALHASGKRVWLLSNAQRMFTMPEIRLLGLEPYFDGICLSSDCGFKKPDPRFFQQLLREQHILPERAVMIGNDAKCDILGAQAVGLSTIYIRSNLSPREPIPKADYILSDRNLPALQQILTQQGLQS